MPASFDELLTQASRSRETSAWLSRATSWSRSGRQLERYPHGPWNEPWTLEKKSTYCRLRWARGR